MQDLVLLGVMLTTPLGLFRDAFALVFALLGQEERRSKVGNFDVEAVIEKEVLW